MKMRLWYSVFFAFTLIYSVEAQQLMGEKLAGLVQVDTFPSRLLQTRTAVLLGGDIKNQQEWEQITGIIHDNLRKPGIDAVAYYRIEQIYAGVEVTRSFALDLMKREINNLVLVNYKPDISQVAILVPDYTKGLVTPQQPAWMASGRLDRVMFQVYAQSANAKLVRTNFLVNDLPEDGLMTDPISGRRAQFFSLTLNEGKMAVPQWGKATEDSLLVETLRQHYPYEFGLVDALDSDV
ncbi:MAG: hypothetical protein OEX02_16030, partial [Cyclobacteriaceae bacterium]|nr:hypothetical protein [Cyclobacteriaceae bacterium]